MTSALGVLQVRSGQGRKISLQTCKDMQSFPEKNGQKNILISLNCGEIQLFEEETGIAYLT
jgi:hypothetical protein